MKIQQRNWQSLQMNLKSLHVMYHATLTMVELKFLISKSPNKKILDAPNPWDPNLLPSSQILLKEMGLWLFNLGTNLWSLLFGYLKTIHDVDELLKILTSIHGIMGPWGWVFVGGSYLTAFNPYLFGGLVTQSAFQLTWVSCLEDMNPIKLESSSCENHFRNMQTHDLMGRWVNCQP